MRQNNGLKLSSRRRLSFSKRSGAKRSTLSPFKIYSLLILALATAGTLCGPVRYARRANAQNVRPAIQQDLERVFSSHEDVTVDPQRTAQSVKDRGRMSLVTRSRTFEMQLRPHDLRAANYRAEEVGLDGVTRPVEMTGVSTYRGNVEGVWASDVRFTINETGIEGMIITPEESYYLEPAQKYSSSANSTDYVFYRASDVRPDIVRTCANTLSEKIALKSKELVSGDTDEIEPSSFSPFKLVEIATESDFEFTSAFSGSAAANNDILSILNQIDAIFERDIGMTFTVVFQHSWDTPNDPYTTNGDGPAMLTEFTNYWNANFTANSRDVAHMWTGRSLGGSSGIAWMGVVCNSPTNSYGVSRRETINTFRVGIPAHEIGHNFNATHADAQGGCANTIMVATQSPSNTLTFCPFSINEITNFATANSSCLSNVPPSNPIDQTDFFVRQHYSDFLARTPDPAGFDFWTRQISECGTNTTCIEVKRVNVSASFFLSIEFQQTGYLVERAYKTAYGDANGISTFGGTHNLKVPVVRFNEFLTGTLSIANGVIVGQAGWEQTLENNKVSYFNSFVQTGRFTSSYPPTMPPGTFVHTLNVNAGNPLSITEEAQLTVEHTTGAKTRAQVVRQIAEHQNLSRAEFNRAFVLMQYFGYLRRNPNDAPDSDYTGYDFWLTKLNQFNGDYIAAEMVKAFLSSIEYRRRFGTP